MVTEDYRAQSEQDRMAALMELCVQNCSDCYKMCVFTAVYCLQTGGLHAEEQHIKLLLDCADICHLAVNLMLRNSGYLKDLCYLCEAACRKCGEDCKRFENNEQMQACLDVCLETAGTCREMTSAM